MKYLLEGMNAAPPPERWDDWTELDASAWPRRVERKLSVVPTICFNCESGCGLLAYVDQESGEIRRFEGNPLHPGSRGRVCAKGPATINQIRDPDRILYPLKRVGNRDEASFERVSWEEVLDTLASRIRKALLENRHDELMYHVGRPGHDKMMHHVLGAWGIDGHNSHTNVCSSAARLGYTVMCGGDRPSPDYANAKTTLLLSAHLESGHYFNPHAQRIIEAQQKGGKLIVMDPRLSNTAAKADLWLPTWPGSEATVLLAIGHRLLTSGRVDLDFLRDYTNWQDTLQHLQAGNDTSSAAGFDEFLAILTAHYAEYTFERATAESGVDAERLERTTDWIANAGSAFSSHVWRGPATGNLGGWQIARAVQLINVLTGSVGAKGGTSLAGWNKFVPDAPTPPGKQNRWNELLYPADYPLTFHEMSILLPYLVDSDHRIDTYFTRVFNPVWTYPDGTAWIDLLCDEERMGCHVALTPTWNETARYADFVLPMGLSAERHDLVSQETHAGSWIGFRQPIHRVLAERAGETVEATWETNPGEVWEEEEFFLELSWRIDPDGSLGIRRHFESPYRPGEKTTLDERYRWIFENSVPGLPAAAAAKGMTPLEYMRRFGAFEVTKDVYEVHREKGFGTPSGKIEIFSRTLEDWGWPEHSMPGSITSHVAKSELTEDEMVLIPTFRLATLIHSRSANSEWLYEISHNNPLWMHPSDAARLGVDEQSLVRVATSIGHFVLRPFVTEGLLPGIVACSHHLGRWHVPRDGDKTSRWASAPVAMTRDGDITRWRRLGDEEHEPGWWRESGVHQNITFPVHPDPMSGMHCWHQKVRVSAAESGDRFGDILVDRGRAQQVYQQWRAMTRKPEGELRRPLWLPRSMRPTDEAYRF
ncbi:MAG: molybdopterin-dependent oxidoreductase [Thermoanaerobaculia bacterium]|nr:molybdopterin-dependent oxidoreductase [Thermoanaerobaculia bacterium]